MLRPWLIVLYSGLVGVGAFFYIFEDGDDMRPFLGVSYLAGMHKDFPVDRALRVFDGIHKPALAVLWKTFGDSTEIFDKYISRVEDRPHILEIYLMNQVCVRHGNCARGELFRRWSVRRWNNKLANGNSKVLKKVRERVIEIRETLRELASPNTRLILNIGLEDNFTTPAAKVLIRNIREVWPYEIARNPMHGSMAGADIMEVHHTGIIPVRGIGVLDGEEIVFPHRRPTIPKHISPESVRKWIVRNRGALAIMLWSALHQGLHGSTTSVPAPRKRKPKVPRKDVIFMNRLLREVQ